MSMWMKLSLVTALGLSVAACDNERDEKEHASQDHVWQGQVNALEKAKGVENTLMESAEQQRKLMEQQNGAGE